MVSKGAAESVEIKPKVEEKPKWKAFGSEPTEESAEERAADIPQQCTVKAEIVKREPVEEAALLVETQPVIDKSLPMQFKPVKTRVEPEEEIDETVKTKEEKLEAAKSSVFKKEKVVAFKKRNKDQGNMRERLNDD